MGKVKIRPAVLPKQQLFILAICRFAEPGIGAGSLSLAYHRRADVDVQLP